MSNSWDVLPEAFLEKVQEIVPESKIDSVLSSYSTFRPTTFRTNLLKITTEKLEELLQKENIVYEKVDWYSDAFILVSPTRKEFLESSVYKNGYIYVQSLSSMIPPLVLDPQKDEQICDLTSAPGSKTTQIASIMGNTGTIVANDKSRIRMYKLEANLKLQGVTNTKTTYSPGEIFWKRNVETFDRTLVDVPCSMEGRFNTQDEKTYRDWSVSKVKQLVNMQRFLLRSGVSTTKPGGVIVYSTCTMSPEENEGVVDWVLEKEKGAVVVEKIEQRLQCTIPGLVSYKNKTFDPSMKDAVRILPSSTMEGFFIVKLRKLKSTVPPLFLEENR